MEVFLKQLMLPGEDFTDYLPDDQSCIIGYLTFKDAVKIYSSHISNPVTEERFTLDILDQGFGLPVNIIKQEVLDI